jgi:2-methylcitrate dehydratase PrpD
MNTHVPAQADAPSITRLLAEYVAQHRSMGWPAAVEDEARRTFLNWLGCAIGASHHPTVDAALAAVLELGPNAQATVLGRDERVNVADAALLNGIASHVFDFDDTHLQTIIHPAGPVASAALALAERYELDGRRLIDALVLGVDVECRIGIAIYPEHYDRGWHITGSTGVLGAAAASARMLGLDSDRTQMALGIAASQPVGVREQFGSMTKAFHVGAAARAGLLAALLARHGYTASTRALEAPRGLLQTYSDRHDWNAIRDGLGERFEIARNTYKPFACGIVIHPAIDGCIRLGEAHGLRADDIDRIEVRVHPLVLELCGKKAPRSGLEGKFSVYHACAAAIVFRQAGVVEFSDAIVSRQDIVALRERVHAQVDAAVAEDQCDVTIACRDGRRLHVFVEHALGSLQRPMTDADLERKFHALVDSVLGEPRAEQLHGLCNGLANASASEVRMLAELTRPSTRQAGGSQA